MPRIRRPFLALTLTALACVSTARGSELLGTIKSVDAAEGKIVVIPKEGGGKAVELMVKDATSWVNIKGKTPKKFDLAKVKKGTEVDVTYEDATATKVVIMKKAAKKKAAKA